MKISPTALSEINNFRAVGDRLGTAGQPTREQFRMVREAGFEAVINLALPTSDNALPNEGSVVTGLGMSYVHIPVDFKAPTSQDFRAFCRVMEAFDKRPLFVHCTANKRVSAFVFLYRVSYQRIALPEAERDLHSICSGIRVMTPPGVRVKSSSSASKPRCTRSSKAWDKP